MSETDTVGSQPNSIADRKQTPKLNAALAKAQAKFVQPEKNKEVEVKKEGRVLYTTRYADLKNVIEAFRLQLTEVGLSFTQKTVETSRGWRLVLVLRHDSGEYDESSMPINLEGAPQQVGSQLTYLKRYQAAAYFGIAADDDDDANATTGNEAKFTDRKKSPPPQKEKAPASNGESSKPPPARQGPKMADQATMERLLDLMIDRGVSETSVNSLIHKGYGFTGKFPPLWVAQEVGALLENEDCTDATIEAKFNEVIERRKNAGGKNA